MVSYTEMDFFRNEDELAMINILTQKKIWLFRPIIYLKSLSNVKVEALSNKWEVKIIMNRMKS